MKEITDIQLIYIACKDRDEAKNIANSLVKNKLAACCSIFPQINSIYEWEGKICDETEALLMVKSIESNFESIKQHVLQLHSYDVPEIVAVRADNVHFDYAKWIHEVVDV